MTKRKNRRRPHFTHDERTEILKQFASIFLAEPIKVLALLVLMAVILEPLAYARGGKISAGITMFVGFLSYAIVGRAIDRMSGFVCSLTVGLTFALFFREYFTFTWAMSFGGFLGLALGITAGLLLFFGDLSLPKLFFGNPRKTRMPGVFEFYFSRHLDPLTRKARILCWIGVLSTSIGIVNAYSKGTEEYFQGVRPLVRLLISLRTLLPAVPLAALSLCFAFPLGFFFGRRIRPALLIFGDLWIYLRQMSAALTGFMLGYFAIVLLFAGFYGAAWRLTPNEAFHGISANPSFADFLYFSMMTVSTLGYAEITPASKLVKAVTSIETVLGIGWITIVFATHLARMQPKFQEIAEQRK